MDKHSLRVTAAQTLESVLPYTAYEIDTEEHLTTVPLSVDDVAEKLRECGYHYQLFSARKQHPTRDDKDSGSYARIPDSHPPEAADTGLEPLESRECQYHVQLFEREQQSTGRVLTELYGHYEVHPYPWTPTWDMTRPYPRHYYPTWDRSDNDRDEWTYLRGVCDPRLNDVFPTL